MKNTIDLSRLSKHLANEDEKKRLEPYLSSFSRRVVFCEYHYARFDDLYKPRTLALAGLLGGEHEWEKISAEAESDAFLLNLHALVDSLPYLGCVVLSAQCETYQEYDAGWNKEWLKKFAGFDWFSKFSGIQDLEEFDLLQAYANVSKHRHLPPKKNNLSFLRIADFIWSRKNKSVSFPEVELKSFMQSEHDVLLQKVVDVMNDVADSLDMQLGLKNTDK